MLSGLMRMTKGLGIPNPDVRVLFLISRPLCLSLSLSDLLALR